MFLFECYVICIINKGDDLMQGSMYSDALKEKAIAMLGVKTVREVSKKLKIPESTLRDWNRNATKINPELAELRDKKKKDFANKAWEVINESLEVTQKRIHRLNKLEENVDIVAGKIRSNAEDICKENQISLNELKDIINELQSLKVVKVSELSVLIGTMFDKQALVNNEPTEITKTKLEDFEE